MSRESGPDDERAMRERWYEPQSGPDDLRAVTASEINARVREAGERINIRLDEAMRGIIGQVIGIDLGSDRRAAWASVRGTPTWQKVQAEKSERLRREAFAKAMKLFHEDRKCARCLRRRDAVLENSICCWRVVCVVCGKTGCISAALAAEMSPCCNGLPRLEIRRRIVIE